MGTSLDAEYTLLDRLNAILQTPSSYPPPLVQTKDLYAGCMATGEIAMSG